jgi:hypothetical protein
MPLTVRAAAVFASISLAPASALAQQAQASSASGTPNQTRPPPATARAATAAHRSASDTPDAIMPGFETLADGSTRLYIELSKPVTYETKVARGVITYVLKGAHVDRRNNYNPLVTVHFNTPVTSARLVPHGHDLWFVVVLRANVQPTVFVDAGKDGGALMRIELPKGDYLPAASKRSSEEAPPPDGAGTPAPPSAAARPSNR